MSFVKPMLTCPCKTRACRIMRARRVLVIVAGLAVDLFIAAKFGWL